MSTPVLYPFLNCFVVVVKVYTTFLNVKEEEEKEEYL